ncbi:hypothetical protein [Wenzhouxiangella sediminis]|uniref:DUF5666 domain-containing protein n=1 Tax=Wenzhouxiangella sediminis TaxID=1792836 RepID=A0A3E1KA14_9GAMM|nr:hypothetical protein [Wenzhouxiangella sediminis]RFF31102.1 hypothetical protein DZC52_05815 [Wenzhouxiangella sediminis]
MKIVTRVGMFLLPALIALSAVAQAPGDFPDRPKGTQEIMMIESVDLARGTVTLSGEAYRLPEGFRSDYESARREGRGGHSDWLKAGARVIVRSDGDTIISISPQEAR